MVSRDEFGKLVIVMKSVYADPKFMADKYAVDKWYELLCDLDPGTLKMAIDKHMMTSEFPPTIASLRKLCVVNTGLNEQEACALLRKALRNGIYGAEEEYSKLPVEVQKAVGSPENIREWCQLPGDEIETVIMSQFLRSYRVVQKRVEENLCLPERMRTLITATVAKLLPEKKKEDVDDAVLPPEDLMERIRYAE